MKKIAIPATAAMLAMLMLVPAAMAQETTMMEETTMLEGSMMEESTMMSEGSMMEETTMMMDEDLPESGGPAILLPAAALLLGSGVLAFAVLRRR